MTDEAPHNVLSGRGIRLLGSELRLKNIAFDLKQDTASTPQIELRTDMWSYWLEDAIEATATACQIAKPIPKLTASLMSAEDKAAIEAEIDERMLKELRASMRAITGSAFAMDGFYGVVKARFGAHPDEQKWVDNGTSRKCRITETIRQHLRLTVVEAKRLKECVSRVFQYRDWAVHMASEFGGPAFREDAQVNVDWHFSAFRYENAVSALTKTIVVLDELVSALDRRSKNLADCKRISRERMDAVLAAYASIPELPKLAD
ncbi:Uncharacterised protein [Mycobacteroides abscessus subsp. abscessus]|uniref:hypothetical protein n=1 Tax=Mycobacteroides abscessus TaxID=36809 RepID=UPI0009C91B93|nr:hypothetical protein [Mycobacteroides abscessus]SLH95390.1 Uncharacterised protein [Mycobacteroides abscessus subsp. abscessus]